MRPSSIRFGESPSNTPFFNLERQQYRPVRMLYLLGVHTADEACMSVNRIPSFANSLQFGVGTAEWALYTSMSPQPRSSARMYTTFGFFVAVPAAASFGALRITEVAPSPAQK